MEPLSDDLENRVKALLSEAQREGYQQGLSEGISRLEMLAAVVEDSVTKRWLIRQCGNEAASLKKRLRSK